jgi:hypothetical protein
MINQFELFQSEDYGVKVVVSTRTKLPLTTKRQQLESRRKNNE